MKLTEESIEEQSWALKNGCVGEGLRWYDQNDILRKAYYPDVELGITVYYSEAVKLHRLIGPALIWDHGGVEFWINGKRIEVQSQEEFDRYLKLKAFL